MYLPEAFRVEDHAEVEALLRRLPFGCLITHGPQGLFASHLPLIHDRGSGVLAGHLARANPHQSLAPDAAAAMVIFQGTNAYVSPNWYPSKAEHGRVVPTWNYEVVHVHGQIRWRDDAEWLRANVNALTERFEADHARPWSVDDAPLSYIDGLITGIVGVEIQIDRIEAKRKLSQNRSEADRAGVISGLAACGGYQDMAVAASMLTERAEFSASWCIALPEQTSE